MIPISLYFAVVASDTWFPVSTINSTPLVDGGSAAADRLRAFPAPLLNSAGCGQTIDEVGVAVRTALPNEEVRIGLYADDGTGYPGALIVDFGALSVDTVTDVKSSASQLIDCSAGPIWAAIWQSSGAKLAGLAPSSFGPGLGVLDSFSNEPVVGYQSVQTYTVGASVLPSTFPAGASKLTHNSGGLPTFYVHFE
jgi:hypothetical protein